MFGTGLIKGLSTTLKHVRDTFTDDNQKTPSRYEGSMEQLGNRRVMNQPNTQEGILTLQYPEEKRLLPERFRYIPMLLFDTEKNEDRCTACGICAKVCPPQCIWIVRDTDANGKPVTRPAEFYIDASICMSCSFCVEFCPFTAIKMNHDYELAVFERYPTLVYNKAELTVPLEYYAALWPTQFAEEQIRLAEEEAAEKAKQEARAAADAAKKVAADAKAAAAPAADTATDAVPAPQGAALSGAERAAEMKRKAQEAAARRKAEAAGEAVPATETASAAEAVANGDSAAPAAEPELDAEAAAKKARIEEMKRKAQEAAARRKAEGG